MQVARRQLTNNTVYTNLEDVENAIEILLDSSILKIDELEGTQRVFYETLLNAFGNKQFTRFEDMANNNYFTAFENNFLDIFSISLNTTLSCLP